MVEAAVSVVVVVLLAAAIAAVWGPMQRAGRRAVSQRAVELFQKERDRLQAEFFETAAASGKPRGLRWKHCDYGSEFRLVRDRANGDWLGLLQVTIQFEAIPGSDMEGLPAVGNLRAATAVFSFAGGKWSTMGRTVMNLNPEEAAMHFQKTHESMENPKSDT